jgi:hypothetical protein
MHHPSTAVSSYAPPHDLPLSPYNAISGGASETVMAHPKPSRCAQVSGFFGVYIIFCNFAHNNNKLLSFCAKYVNEQIIMTITRLFDIWYELACGAKLNLPGSCSPLMCVLQFFLPASYHYLDL